VQESASPTRRNSASPTARLTGASRASGRVRSATPACTSLPLHRAVDRWLADGRAQGWSQRTLSNRRHMTRHLLWWLENEAGLSPTLESLTPATLRAFLVYIREPSESGRWSSGWPAAKRGARPSTVDTYYRCLRALTSFCLAEGLMESSPLANVKRPRVPQDQVQPLDQEQVQALLDAARRTRAPSRDVALVMLLVDTGMRVSEVIGVTVADVDRGTGELTVVGKGNKRRRVYMGTAARRALWRYLTSFASFGGDREGQGWAASF
jgi:site-specific recombinase XerD